MMKFFLAKVMQHPVLYIHNILSHCFLYKKMYVMFPHVYINQIASLH